MSFIIVTDKGAGEYFPFHFACNKDRWTPLGRC